VSVFLSCQMFVSKSLHHRFYAAKDCVFETGVGLCVLELKSLGYKQSSNALLHTESFITCIREL